MAVQVLPVTGAALPAVGEFLAERWGAGGLTPAQWVASVTPPWRADAPDHGFMLVDGERIVGAYLLLYADRTIRGRDVRVANLATWFVEPSHRLHSIRLLKAVLAVPDVHFTDLTPAANVAAINGRLGFRALDTTLAAIPGLPYPTVPGGGRISASPEVIEKALAGPALDVYRDHAETTAVRNLVLVRGDRACHVMVGRTRIRGVDRFATVLYASDPALFRAMARRLARYLLVHERVVATLVEVRIAQGRPRPSVLLRMDSNRRMYRSDLLEPRDVDYLYSEVTWAGRDHRSDDGETRGGGAGDVHATASPAVGDR